MYVISGLYDATAINGIQYLDTSQATNMSDMFADDSSITDLDLSNFNTSQTTKMVEMFRNNYSLKNLNVTSFDTSHVTTMERMFNATRSLTELDLSNFHTPNVTNMNTMMYGNNSLQKLNLANLDTSHVNDMEYFIGIDIDYYVDHGYQLNEVNLGPKANIDSTASFPKQGTWQNGSNALSGTQLADNGSHPGTWVKK